jgi:hypothetical protein
MQAIIVNRNSVRSALDGVRVGDAYLHLVLFLQVDITEVPDFNKVGGLHLLSRSRRDGSYIQFYFTFLPLDVRIVRPVYGHVLLP